jgi:hypothetical protein
MENKYLIRHNAPCIFCNSVNSVNLVNSQSMPKWTHLNITGKTHGVIEKVIEQGIMLPSKNL